MVQFATVPSDAALSYNLVGLNVYNSAEENVGEIKDIVIASNKLDGYILSVGGFLGLVSAMLRAKRTPAPVI